MQQSYKLSLTSAIIININIMLGAGIFINTTLLAQRAHSLGAASYMIIGLLMLPLVLCIAELTHRYPEGGFYGFGRNTLGPMTGFLTAWSYFIGKLASGALMMHTSFLLIQSFIPLLTSINIFVLDSCGILLFVLLNFMNMKSGKNIQATFTVLKLIPILFAILAGLYLLSGGTSSPVSLHWSGLTSTLPLVLYASMGFEAACLMSNKIENPQKNAPRAILISYALALSIAALYQLLFYSAVGTELQTASSYLAAFPALLTKLFGNTPQLIAQIKTVLHLALASSALGGSYGIMFSNTWSLHTLAAHGHTFFPYMLTRLNKHGIPVLCVVIEGMIYLSYLIVSGGTQLALQQISALGVVVAYTISALCLLSTRNSSSSYTQWLLPVAALCSCFMLSIACISSLRTTGLHALYMFILLIASALVMFYIQKK